MTAKTITIMSPKGGVGKTTVSVNLATALAGLDKKVLIIDTNVETPHVAIYFGFVGYKYSLEDVLNGKVDITYAIYKTDVKNLHILPCRIFKERGDGNAKYRLINLFHHINKISNDYDFIILDSKPSAGVDFLKLMKNVATLIVSTPEITSVIEAKKLNEESKLNGVNVIGAILNKVNRKTRGTINQKEVKEILKIEKLWEVPEDAKVFEALERGIPIVESNRKAHASRAFVEIAKDLVNG